MMAQWSEYAGKLRPKEEESEEWKILTLTTASWRAFTGVRIPLMSAGHSE
jgi:hypothetical protein